MFKRKSVHKEPKDLKEAEPPGKSTKERKASTAEKGKRKPSKEVPKKTLSTSMQSSSLATASLERNSSASMIDDPTGGNQAEFRLLQAKEPNIWTVSDVGKWLQFTGLEPYKKAFIENYIGGPELFSLTEDDLTAMGVTALGHRKKLLRNIRELSGDYPDLSEDTSQIDDTSVGSHVGDSALIRSESISSPYSLNEEDADESVSFKCNYEGDVRVIRLKTPDLTKLKQRIKEEYGHRYNISYKDDDDVIVVKKERHLQEAVALTETNTPGTAVRLTLTKKPSSSTGIITKAESTVLESLIDSVIVIDVLGKIIFINKSAEKLFQYVKSDIVGQNVKILMSSTHSRRHDGYIKNYLITGKSSVIGVGRNVKAKKKDGSTVVCWLSISETKKKGKKGHRDRHTFTATIHPLKQAPPLSLPASTVAAQPADSIVKTNSPHVANVANVGDVLGGQSSDHLQIKTSIDNKRTSTIISKTESDRSLPRTPSSAEDVMKAHASILDALLDASILVNQREIIQCFNTAASKLFGHTPFEAIGRSVSLLLPSGSPEGIFLNLDPKTGQTSAVGKTRDILTQAKDGSMRPMLLTVTENTVGSVRYYIGTFRLPTESEQPVQKTLLQQVREVIENLVTPGIVIAEKGTIQAMNAAASQLLGYGLIEVLGQNVKRLMPSPYHEEHDSYIKNYLTTGVKKIIGLKEREVLAKHKNGKSIPVFLSITERQEDNRRVFIGLLRPK